MSKTTLLQASLLSLVALSALPAAAQDGPPGMVLIQGGRFDIGAKKDYIKDLIEETQLRPLASEYPEYSAKLDDFYYMPTEVTNEQFAAFVEATGSEPPQSWGQAAIDAAGLAYATEIGKAKKDAREAGLPTPEFDPFNASLWWKKNWEEAEWKVPAGLEAHPVVFINYERAEAYARWAGLRPISQEEHQVAGRGDSEALYPWGDEYLPGAVNCVEAKLGKTAPVGTYEAGASWIDAKGRVVERTERNAGEVQGIYDLSGSVWEWTRTPYSPHPGFKPLEVKIQGSKEKLSPEFDANNLTAVSADFGSPTLATRLTTRRGTDRIQATAGLGMRCSASTTPGLDIAESILRMDLPTSKRPDDTFYRAESIVAIDRWVSERGTAKPENYRVIRAYDYMAVIPVEESRMQSISQIRDRSLEKPLELGAFSSTIPVMEPALAPGTYTLSWRGAGELRGSDRKADKEAEEGEEGEEAVVEEPEFPFDLLVDTLIFRDTEGEIVAWMPCGEPEEIRLGPGRVALHQREAEVLKKRELDAGQVPLPAATIATIHFSVPSKKSNKGFEFSVPLALAPGAVDSTWRK